MKVSMMAVAVAATTLVAGAAVAGCGNDKESHPASSKSSSAASSSASPSSSSPTSSTPAAQLGDYSNLLIKPEDIALPGDTFTVTTQPISNPGGIEGVFLNQTSSRKIDISIYVYANPAEAAQALDVNSKAIPELSTNAPVTPVDLGTAGVIALGPSPDGAKAKGITMFTQGKVLAVVELEGAPDDPIDQGFILDLSRKQDDKIKAGMPS